MKQERQTEVLLVMTQDLMDAQAARTGHSKLLIVGLSFSAIVQEICRKENPALELLFYSEKDGESTRVLSKLVVFVCIIGQENGAGVQRMNRVRSVCPGKRKQMNPSVLDW